MPPALPTMSRNQCAPVCLTYDAEACWARSRLNGHPNLCHTKSDTKICERFHSIRFNGVMRTLAYVAPDLFGATRSNMPGLVWLNRLTKSRLALGAFCLVIT